MTSRYIPTLLLTAALAAFALPAVAAEAPAADQQLVDQAVQTNEGVIDAGNLAKDSAASPAVRELADKMVLEHTMAKIELTNAVKAAELAVPDTSGLAQPAKVEQLAKLQGDAFDQQYLSELAAGERALAAVLEKVSKEASSDHLKDWAARALPAAQSRIKQAEQLKASLKA